MTVADSHPRELLFGHVLGILDAEEEEVVERHLATGCARCAAEVAALHRNAGLLAESVPPVTPSAVVRQRILEAGRRQRAAGRPSPTEGGRRSPLSWGTALAAALAVAALGLAFWPSAHYRGVVGRLIAERDALVRELSEARERLRQEEMERVRLTRQLKTMTAPRMRLVVLAGLADAPGASARTFVDPEEGRALFVARGLPDLPPDRTYQLWYITGAGPVSAGTFGVAAGQAELAVEDVPAGGVQAWAVTREPAGGVPQPTGPMVLRG